jgi:hypothetical protein
VNASINAVNSSIHAVLFSASLSRLQLSHAVKSRRETSINAVVSSIHAVNSLINAVDVSFTPWMFH